jgi:hypothetical protein
MGVPGRSESLVGIGASKVPRRFPPHVHYLEVLNKAGGMTENPNPVIPVRICWEWCLVIKPLSA